MIAYLIDTKGFRVNSYSRSKYGFGPNEIAIYSALLSGVNSDTQKVVAGNEVLMQQTGIKNRHSFRVARDNLIGAEVISIVSKGIAKRRSTIYWIMMLFPEKNTNKT